jgi:hypothetical protein
MHGRHSELEPTFESPSIEPGEAEEPGYIIRRKQFLVEPMGEEEALEQMELLGHDFYVFFNPQTNGVQRYLPAAGWKLWTFDPCCRMKELTSPLTFLDDGGAGAPR